MTLTQKYIAFKTILRLDALRTLRLWKQTLVPPMLTTALYFIVFGHVLGRHINVHGKGDYATFIAPGLIMMQTIMTSYGGTVFVFFHAKLQRYIQSILVSPMSNFLILSAYMCVGIVRGILTGLVVTIVSLFFTHLRVHSILLLCLVALLSSATFSLCGLINAIYAKKFDDISIVPNFVITPLVYFGGIFYTINMLPKDFRFVSQINPIFYIVETFRYGFLGLSPHLFERSILILIGMFVTAFLVALWIFKKGAGLRS